MAFIIKGNGERELFQPDKLEQSLRGSGADDKMVRNVMGHITPEVEDGMTTNDIYRHAFDLLKRYGSRPVAARYSLKRAVMDLGPSGFPFEKLLARIFEEKGYRTRTDVILQGKCARHEIDLFAEKKDTLVVGEAKFHNRTGFKTDLKVALYIDARFRDLRENNFDGWCKEGMHCQTWLVTNTKFTRNAISYALCGKQLKLVGWDYPKNHNLREMIEDVGLHPVTCLTTLSTGDKKRLFDMGHVLCRAIRKDNDLLREIGVTGRKADEVLEETELLCIPQKG